MTKTPLTDVINDSMEGSTYYPLFKHMADNHDLTLLETELGDIVNVVIGIIDKNGLFDEYPLAVIYTMCLKRLNKEQFKSLKEWVDSYHPINWDALEIKFYEWWQFDEGDAIFNWFKNNVK